MSNLSIVIMAQPETEVYAGDTGFIVIKQKDWQDEEMVILIDPIHAETIAKAILASREDAMKFFEDWKDKENDLT